MRSVPVAAIRGILHLKTHIPEGEQKKRDHVYMSVSACDLGQEAHRRHLRNIKNRQ